MSRPTPTPALIAEADQHIAAVKLVGDLLEKHHPVEFCQWSVQFELNYCTCVCGQWVGQGAWFQQHRAEEIVKAIESSEDAE